MLKVHINVMRGDKILAHGSFETAAPEYDALPTERFHALAGVETTDEDDAALLEPILAWFLAMLARGEARSGPAD
jgi:hypothetical protein